MDVGDWWRQSVMHGCWRLMETISDAWMLETDGDNQ